jgi:hypothetical protein
MTEQVTLNLRCADEARLGQASGMSPEQAASAGGV